MKEWFVLVAASVAILSLACGDGSEPGVEVRVQTATETPTPTSAPTLTPIPSPTATPTPTAAPTATPMATDSAADKTQYWYYTNFSSELEAASPQFEEALLAACYSSAPFEMASAALEQVTDVWEYGKAAALHNVATEWWNAACAVKANPGTFLPLPPVSLANQMRDGSYVSQECGNLAVQMEALFLAMAERPYRSAVYFELNPALEPLEERWLSGCE